MATVEEIRQVLGQVQDPQMNQSLTTLNMLKDITVKDKVVAVTVELKIPNYPYEDKLKQNIQAAVKALPDVDQVDVGLTTKLIKSAEPKQPLPGVKNIVAVYACKGGVGKSTVATNLATALKTLGKKVGLLDADIHGPNIPLMMGIQDNPSGAPNNKLQPLESHGVKLMSLGFLTNTKMPSMWRGPMVHGAVQQLLRDTLWGDLDFLIIDLPPGTGDAQLTIAQSVPLAGVVFVTTPQAVSLVDGIKGIGLFQKFQIPLLGLIENMSGFECSECHHVTDIFSKDGGKLEAEKLNIPFLGAIPIDPAVVQGGDSGQPIVLSAPKSNAAKNMIEIAKKISKLD